MSVLAILLKSMDEQRRKAFDFAQETSKQLITLATAIIGLTITFAKDFVGSVHGCPRFLAILAWVLLLASVAFGLLTLMALTGSLESSATTVPSIRGRNVTRPAVAQIFLFFFGLLTAVLFGVLAGSARSANPRTQLPGAQSTPATVPQLSPRPAQPSNTSQP